MSLERLLRLLPLGLAALVALEMAMMVVQDGLSRATFEQTRVAQFQRDALGRVRTNCDAVTFKAVAWTLTRRNTQGRQYQEGKAACFDSVAQAKRLLSSDQELAALSEDLGKLTTLLEAIQAEHTDDTKMVTVGFLEREVQPLNAAISEGSTSSRARRTRSPKT
jgi:hypothetical protein